MNIAKSVNIARLATAYNLQIDSAMLPDNLKCVKCKLVLQDACQVPCGCRFCRACIDEMMASGSEFCPGLSEDCGESLLSGFATDYSRNKRISRWAVKCPQKGCENEYPLVEIEDHIRVCGKRSIACPFRELGCQQKKLASDEMSGHFQEENRSHCEILIGMIADITREMESHKREIEILKRSDESSKMEIETLKRSDESSKMEIEELKVELVLKDGRISMIIDQMEHVENEIKLIKREKVEIDDRVQILSEKIEQVKVDLGGRVQILTEKIDRENSDLGDRVQILAEKIDREKAELGDRVQILSEKIDREMDERRKNNERDIANLIRELDREITKISEVIESNKDELETSLGSVRDDIRSINRDSIKSIKAEMDSIQSNLKSTKALVTAGLVDASCEWTIDVNLANVEMSWDWSLADTDSVTPGISKEYFTGAVRQYRYRLASTNVFNKYGGVFYIYLRIYPGPSDAQLPWPFKASVSLTVADRIKREACHTITRPCEINRPANNHWSLDTLFESYHSSLTELGVDMARGVHVSCTIVPYLARR